MWDRLWAIARIDLQLSDEEWLDLSYRQFSLLHERQRTLQWREEWRTGSVIAAVYRCGMRNFDPMPKPENFIFTALPGEERKPAEAIAREEQSISDEQHQNIADLFRSISIPATE